jgi:cell division protein FtsB
MQTGKSFSLWIFALALAAVVSYQQYQLWFGEDGFSTLRAQEALYQKQLSKNDKLLEKNDRLSAHIHQIKTSPDAMEGVLRQQMHMIQKGEQFIRYPTLP